MKILLRIDSSLRKASSHSRALADHFQGRWLAKHPGSRVVIRDLAAAPVPHLDAATLDAFFAVPNAKPPADVLSRELITELKAADHLLISAPLYNFGPPSALKAWIDHVVRSGETFQVGTEGYRGLLIEKQATLITTRGGRHDASAPDDDFLTPSLRAGLQFIGITQIEVVRAEGMAGEAAERDEELARARRRIDALIHEYPSGEPTWIGEFSDRDRREIAALRQAQADAIARGDVQAYGSLCTPDIHWLFPGHDVVTGREAFLEAQTRLRPRFHVQAMRKLPLRVERAADVAIEIGRQEVYRTGETTPIRQKYTHIFRKMPEGWRFAVLMSNASE